MNRPQPLRAAKSAQLYRLRVAVTCITHKVIPEPFFSERDSLAVQHHASEIVRGVVRRISAKGRSAIFGIYVADLCAGKHTNLRTNGCLRQGVREGLQTYIRAEPDQSAIGESLSKLGTTWR